ncbi:Ig-like domain-containing protein [Embleya sp. NPDC050154]|uniref:Ig-like domain-containing protein n=1 Tax=unclassified Embleya TaxID=2699296 RepID=UPI0037BB4A25
MRSRDQPEPNLPPVPRAVADRVGTRAGQSVDVPVLAGDSGEGLVVLSYTNPEHGLVLQPDERGDANSVLRYTPGPGFTGRDNFRYTIVDRLGREATASVRIDVAAGPGASGRPVETRAGKLGVHRGVDELRAPSAASAARPRAGIDPGGGSLLVAFLGSALLGAGVLAFVAHRRPGRRRPG